MRIVARGEEKRDGSLTRGPVLARNHNPFKKKSRRLHRPRSAGPINIA